jgi:hypothetical protein
VSDSIVKFIAILVRSTVTVIVCKNHAECFTRLRRGNTRTKNAVGTNRKLLIACFACDNAPIVVFWRINFRLSNPDSHRTQR